MSAEFADDEVFGQCFPDICPEDHISLTTTCGSTHVRVSRNKVDEVPCQVSLRSDIGPETRVCGADVVFVIDCSGSMSDSGKLTVGKLAICRLLELMTDWDRCGVVRFGQNAERVCGLIRCTSTGKAVLKQHIQSISSLDLTDISSGLTLAVDLLSQRRYRNKITSLVLFSDGGSNCGVNPRTVLSDFQREIGKICVLTCGNEEKPGNLKSLSEEIGGFYLSVSRAEDINAVFRYLIDNSAGEILAHDLHINLHTLNSAIPCEITKKYSFSDQNSDFYLESLAGNEKKEWIFVLKPAYVQINNPVRSPIVQISLSYRDILGKSHLKTATLEVKFAKWGVEGIKNIEIYEKWCELEAKKCLLAAKNAIKCGDLDTARVEADKGMNEVKNREGSEVRRELEEVRKRLGEERGTGTTGTGSLERGVGSNRLTLF